MVSCRVRSSPHHCAKQSNRPKTTLERAALDAAGLVAAVRGFPEASPALGAPFVDSRARDDEIPFRVVFFFFCFGGGSLRVRRVAAARVRLHAETSCEEELQRNKTSR